MEFDNTGDLLLPDPSNLLNDEESLIAAPDQLGSNSSLNGSVTLTKKKVTSSSKTKVSNVRSAGI